MAVPASQPEGPVRGAHHAVPDGPGTGRDVPSQPTPYAGDAGVDDRVEQPVASDLRDAPAGPVDELAHDDMVLVPRRTHQRRAWLLLAVALFQVWLWTTRLLNLVNDPEPRTVGFVVVHAVLYMAAFGAAGVLLTLGLRLRGEARR